MPYIISIFLNLLKLFWWHSIWYKLVNVNGFLNRTCILLFWDDIFIYIHTYMPYIHMQYIHICPIYVYIYACVCLYIYIDTQTHIPVCFNVSLKVSVVLLLFFLDNLLMDVIGVLKFLTITVLLSTSPFMSFSTFSVFRCL